jgi:hypothetical protein
LSTYQKLLRCLIFEDKFWTHEWLIFQNGESIVLQHIDTVYIFVNLWKIKKIREHAHNSPIRLSRDVLTWHEQNYSNVFPFINGWKHLGFFGTIKTSGFFLQQNNLVEFPIPSQCQQKHLSPPLEQRVSNLSPMEWKNIEKLLDWSFGWTIGMRRER